MNRTGREQTGPGLVAGLWPAVRTSASTRRLAAPARFARYTRGARVTRNTFARQALRAGTSARTDKTQGRYGAPTAGARIDTHRGAPHRPPRVLRVSHGYA